MTAPGFFLEPPLRSVSGGAKRKNPPPDSLQAVGWKLCLAYCQFLPSPEAPVVFVLIMVVDVVVEIVVDDIIMNDIIMDDIKGRIELARDNMPGIRIAIERETVNCKLAGNGARC